jgi:hypothetical protein
VPDERDAIATPKIQTAFLGAREGKPCPEQPTLPGVQLSEREGLEGAITHVYENACGERANCAGMGAVAAFVIRYGEKRFEEGRNGG